MIFFKIFGGFYDLKSASKQVLNLNGNVFKAFYQNGEESDPPHTLKTRTEDSVIWDFLRNVP